MLLRAARKYRNVQQALDFSAPTASSPGNSWTAEDEMNNYIQSPIPPPQTTDMWLLGGEIQFPFAEWLNEMNCMYRIMD
jgi:hypothetical protein